MNDDATRFLVLMENFPGLATLMCKEVGLTVAQAKFGFDFNLLCFGHDHKGVEAIFEKTAEGSRDLAGRVGAGFTDFEERLGAHVESFRREHGYSPLD